MKRSWSSLVDVASKEKRMVDPSSADAFRVAVLSVLRDALEDILDEEDTLEEDVPSMEEDEEVSIDEPPDEPEVRNTLGAKKCSETVSLTGKVPIRSRMPVSLVPSRTKPSLTKSSPLSNIDSNFSSTRAQ